MPNVGPHARYEQNRNRTHVASRSGSVLGYFRPKNPRKSIGRQKITKIVMRAPDDAWST